MDKRLNSRVDVEHPPTVQTTLTTVNGLTLFKEETTITLNNLSIDGLSFSTDSELSIGQHLVLALPLFSSTNNIFGEIIWMQEKTTERTYGMKIITADFDYFHYMSSFEDYSQNKQADLVGGRQ
ncbi:PilZ domain-containing protein [Aquibacillus albus]|uniref:Tfp pilus assembly protein PilZ n=1 Tax=Aquibacillus albus TaxID=1168171 RepID=A0ABS2MX06_9BACI|nr:PilZ domain-containing protein [Aquibacillus albus]MBM7570433.1 Tfp pilus assembly protein PilZ [Aquibacillus albus]